MADLLTLRTQEFSTNLELLSQQMKPRLSMFTTTQAASGKSMRMLSQIGPTEALDITTSATPAPNIDVALDGRLVFPQKKGWGTVIDDIELVQTNIAPQGAYVRNALFALNRKEDDMFTDAFFGTSQTGETGGTSVVFPTSQQVGVQVGGGGSDTGLNVEKLRAAKQLLLEADVDLDMERIYIAVSPRQHDDLLALTQITSTDFNNDNGKPVLVDGRINEFLGLSFIITNRLPTDVNDLRRNPVWVPSGMGRGIWKETAGRIRNRGDLFDNPDYVEASFQKGFTRLEEVKCVEIKSEEA